VSDPIRHPPNLVAVETEPGRWGANHIVGVGHEWAICECGHHNPDEALNCASAVLDDIGRCAFNTYNRAVGGVTWDGRPIPGWDAVTGHVRDGWRMAALSVRVGLALR